MTEALRTRLAAIEKGRRRPSLDTLRRLAADVSADAPESYSDHGALLYDDDGLPG